MGFWFSLLALGLGGFEFSYGAVLGSDDRATFVQYARMKGVPPLEIENKFSATGTLTCTTTEGKRREGTAQITGTRDVITTAGHMFFGPACRPIYMKSCEFRPANALDQKAYEVRMQTLSVGGCADRDVRVDWAVLNLKTPVPKDIEPYKIPAEDFTPPPSTPIIQVSAFSLNFQVGQSRLKHVVDCTVRDVEHYATYPVLTDCDAGDGTSGSAQLVDSPYGPIMVAMHVASSGHREGSAYNVDSNFSASTPVRSAFLNAVIARLRR